VFGHFHSSFPRRLANLIMQSKAYRGSTRWVEEPAPMAGKGSSSSHTGFPNGGAR
jgi:hypothetical protein